jgi:choline kinase
MIKTAVVLAAGYGKRLNLLQKPKGFINIGGKTLIEYSIEALLKHGIEQIIIGTGFKSHYYDELAKTYSQITTRYNDAFMNSGSLLTFCALKDLIKEDFLLLESDILYDSYCLKELIVSRHQNALLLAVSERKDDGVFVQVDAAYIFAKSTRRYSSWNNENVHNSI